MRFAVSLVISLSASRGLTLLQISEGAGKVLALLRIVFNYRPQTSTLSSLQSSVPRQNSISFVILTLRCFDESEAHSTCLRRQAVSRYDCE